MEPFDSGIGENLGHHPYLAAVIIFFFYDADVVSNFTVVKRRPRVHVGRLDALGSLLAHKREGTGRLHQGSVIARQLDG